LDLHLGHKNGKNQQGLKLPLNYRQLK